MTFDPNWYRGVILHAAMQLLRSGNSLAGMSLTSIARAAGVSQPTVRAHYGDVSTLAAAAEIALSLPGGPGAQINAYLVEHYAIPNPDAECVVCGASFASRRRSNGTRQDVCGSACNVARGKADDRWKLPGPRCKFPSCPNRVNATCVICGELFHAHWNPMKDGSNVLAVTCSRTCGGEWRRGRGQSLDARIMKIFHNRGRWPSTAVRWLPCAWCGKEFISHLGALLCSGECRRRNGNRYSSDRIMQRYYSDPKFRDRVISQAQNRRASKLGLESITQPRELTLFLLERDGNVCGICGGTVIDERGPRQPSVDHIIPLAKRGAHSIDNVQLAHLDCNLSKNDKIIPSVLGYPGERAAA